MIGTILSNRYKLIAELGSGGMAWVYLAEDLVQARQVAVKILYPQHSQELGFVQRFNREAKLSMTLSRSSPQRNIVQVLDYGADRDTHYLVMEYVPGKDLGQLLAEEGPLPLQQALDIARQVALAVDHAAHLEIVHRDIKPSNIMVCPDSTIKVLDFGIARARSSPHLTLSGFVGSPHYAAPEQAMGQPVDIRADLYSLGVVLYRMLSGDLPFQGDTPWAVVNQHIHSEPPQLAEQRSDLPAAVLQLVQKALAKRAQDRFQTPGHFVEAIDAVAGGRDLPPDPLSSPVTLPASVLESRYQQAQEAMQEEKWQQAASLLSQIFKVDPEFGDVGEQLDQVGQQIRLSTLYRNAYRALSGGHWDVALAEIDRIVEVDAEYKDVADLRSMAIRHERPASTDASLVSEFPTQIPPHESPPGLAQDSDYVQFSPLPEDHAAGAALAQSRRQRLRWIAGLLATLVLAAAAYFLVTRPEPSGHVSPVPASPSSRAGTTPLPISPVPSLDSIAQAPTATPAPSRTARSATPPPQHNSDQPPATALSPTPTPGLVQTPTPTLAPTLTPTPSWTPTLRPTSMQPSPPTGFIAFPRFDSARGTYDVHLCQVDGTNCIRVYAEASQPDFSPDGTQLVVHSWKPDDKGLVVVTTAGQHIWQITDQLEAARPSVDYVGERYVYHSRDESDRQPRLFRTFDAETRPIVREGSIVVGQSPSWTPERQILYSGCLANNCGIIIMRADGTFPRQVIPGGNETNPESSPSGEQIAFMSRRDGNWEVYVASIDGETLRRLTQNPGNDGLPTWSPDGRHIAFVTDRDGPWAVWVMRFDGSEQRRLFAVGGPLDGEIRDTSPHEIHGWIEERISWAP